MCTLEYGPRCVNPEEIGTHLDLARIEGELRAALAKLGHPAATAPARSHARADPRTACVAGRERATVPAMIFVVGGLVLVAILVVLMLLFGKDTFVRRPKD